MASSKYNFGEKDKENINGASLPVEFKTPKYLEAKAKAIELLESKEYKDVLKESDFWILVNTYSNKTKAMYSGLIISHDGCLKINDSLDEKLKFKPSCVEIDKEGYKDSLVFIYNCPDQGIYEVGEVSKDNCKNDYPYAMALKRCFDRVVLKNSRIAYSGIYSDSESDEFKEKEEHKALSENKIEAKALESQIQMIRELVSDEKKILDYFKVKKLEDLTVEQASEIIKKKKGNK